MRSSVSSPSRKSQSCRMAAVQSIFSAMAVQSGGIGPLLAAARGVEARVVGVAQQHLLQQPAAAKEPRAHGADRHAENVGGRLVREVLDVDEDDGRTKGLVEAAERLLQRRLQVDLGEKDVVAAAPHLGGLLRRGQRLDVAIFGVDAVLFTLARTEEDVPRDREEPAA